MYKYLLIPVAIFAIGCQPDPTHKMEGYVIQSDHPIRLLQIEDIDKLEGKWWEKRGEDVGFAPSDATNAVYTHKRIMDKLQENKYYVFWYYKKDGKKLINSARMPIEINRKLSEKKANYKEEEEVTVQEGE